MTNKKMRRFFTACMLAAVLIFTTTACGSQAASAAGETSVSADESSAAGEDGTESSAAGGETAAGAAETESRLGGLILTEEDINFKDSDTETDYTASSYVTITGSGDSASADSTDGVVISGGDVTITAEGTYVLEGNFNGSITVTAAEDAKVWIVLNGVTITAEDGPAINVTEADKVTITLADGTTNKAEDSSLRTDETLEAAVYSTSDLVFNGSGSLEVTGNFADAIHGTDDVRIISGTYAVNAVRHGIAGKDRLEIADGSFTISAGGMGLKATNKEEAELGFIYIAGGTFDITAADDGVHAETAVWITDGELTVSSGDDGIHAEETMVLDGGTITVTDSEEGLEAGEIWLNGATVDVQASDDGINAAAGSDSTSDGEFNAAAGSGSTSDGEFNTAAGSDSTSDGEFNTAAGSDSTSDGEFNSAMGSGSDFGPPAFAGAGGMQSSSSGYLYINGGTVTVNAGGDGLDANGAIYQSGGDVIINGSTNNGNGALDYDQEYVMTGGTLMAAGASGMLQTISDTSSAACLTIVDNIESGTVIEIRDENDNAVYTAEVSKTVGSVVLASEALVKGSTYDVYLNGEEAMEITLTDTVTMTDRDGNAATAGFAGGMGFGAFPGDQAGGMGPGGQPGSMEPGGQADGQTGTASDRTTGEKI